ncbi:MAG: PAS domain S-box protein, partial [Syntrophothermus sp.]
MDIITRLATLLCLPRLQDEEQERIAGITAIINSALLLGFIVLIFERIFTGNYKNVLPLAVVIATLSVSALLIYKRKSEPAGQILLWTLYFLLIGMMLRNDGIHDTILLAFPGVIVIAGLIMRNISFYFFTSASVAAITLTGYLEIHGIVNNQYSTKTNLVDITDILIILIIITLVIKILSDNIQKSLSRSRKSEQDLREQANRLRISEEKYRAIIDTANEGILIIDRDNLITFANFKMHEIMHAETNEFLRINIADFIYEEDLADHQKRISERKKGSRETFERRLRRADGTPVWVIISASPIMKPGGEYDGLFAMFTDISKRKAAEEALRESEELHRKLVSTVPDVILRTDLDGNILFVNETVFPSLKYYPKERIVGKNILSFIAPEDRLRAIKNLSRIYTYPAGLAEYRILLDDTTAIYCEVNGDVLRDNNDVPYEIVYVLRDITERKLNQQKLIESEKRLKLLSDAAFEGILLVENGIIRDVNRQLSDMLGCSAEDLIGFSPNKYISLESASQREEILGGKKDIHAELMAIRADGNILPVEVRGKYLNVSSNRITIAAVRDISERKEIENSLRAAKEKAEEMDRLKSNFLAQMSHEIRTPINTILNFVSLIKSDLKNDPGSDMAEIFGIIDSGGRRLIRTIDMILTMSQFQAGGYEVNPVKLNLYKDILHILYNEFMSTARLKQLEFTLENECPCTEITGDA